MSGTTIRCRFRGPRQGNTGPDVPRSEPPIRVARMLALAHHIEHLLGEGVLPSYAVAAQALALTRARLTQIMNLFLLSPEIQERLLTGDIVLTERGLRRVVAEADWVAQERALRSMDTKQEGLR